MDVARHSGTIVESEKGCKSDNLSALLSVPVSLGTCVAQNVKLTDRRQDGSKSDRGNDVSALYVIVRSRTVHATATAMLIHCFSIAFPSDLYLFSGRIERKTTFGWLKRL